VLRGSGLGRLGSSCMEKFPSLAEIKERTLLVARAGKLPEGSWLVGLLLHIHITCVKQIKHPLLSESIQSSTGPLDLTLGILATHYDVSRGRLLYLYSQFSGYCFIYIVAVLRTFTFRS
jgi:hypothetical protein